MADNTKGIDLESGLATPRGIPYAIKEGPTIVAERFGPMTGEAVFIVSRNNALAFVKEIMPAPRKKDGVVTLPKSFVPMCPDDMRPMRVTVDSFAQDRPLDVFDLDKRKPALVSPFLATYEDYALITVEFGTSIDGLIGGELSSAEPHQILEPTFNATVEMLSIHNNKFIGTTSANGKPINPIRNLIAPIIKVIPNVERSYTWGWALDPDFELIFSSLGMVNGEAIQFLEYAYPETIMFLGVTGKRDYRFQFANNARNPSVQMVWSLDYKFAQRKIVDKVGSSTRIFGWNDIFNPDDMKWARLGRSRDGSSDISDPLYIMSDFSNLFRATTV